MIFFLHISQPKLVFVTQKNDLNEDIYNLFFKNFVYLNLCMMEGFGAARQ